MQKTRKKRRNTLLGLIHQGTGRMFGDDHESHRSWVHARTGKRSCRDCTDAQLQAMVKELCRNGVLDGKMRGGQGVDRPTSRQWAKLAALARARGWRDGLEDKRLAGFIRRTAKVSSPRFLTRVRISQVITGLSHWQQQTDNEPKEER